VVLTTDILVLLWKAEKSSGRHQKEMACYYYRKHRDPPSYPVGDRCGLDSADLYPRLSQTKIDPRFVGPYSIVEVSSLLNMTLQLPDFMVRFHPSFHVCKVKPYCG
jgi:hypothetical protein